MLLSEVSWWHISVRKNRILKMIQGRSASKETCFTLSCACYLASEIATAFWELKVVITLIKRVAHLQCADFCTDVYSFYQRGGKQMLSFWDGAVYHREERLVLINHMNCSWSLVSEFAVSLIASIVSIEWFDLNYTYLNHSLDYIFKKFTPPPKYNFKYVSTI